MTAPEPAGGLPPTRAFESVAVGDALPPATVEVTNALVVGGAIVSRDFDEVHRDPARARARGLPDIIMNVHTCNGLVGSYVGAWAGPEAVVRRQRIRLGVPATPGERARYEGTVVATELVDGAGVVRVELAAVGQAGQLLSGQVELALPLRPSSGGAPADLPDHDSQTNLSREGTLWGAIPRQVRRGGAGR